MPPLFASESGGTAAALQITARKSALEKPSVGISVRTASTMFKTMVAVRAVIPRWRSG